MSRIFLAALLALSACSAVSPIVVTEQAQPFHPPLPVGIKTTIPTWKVLTPDITKKLNDDVKSGKELPYAYFGLDEKNYLSFSQYMLDVQRYVKQLLATACYYRKDLNEPQCKVQDRLE